MTVDIAIPFWGEPALLYDAVDSVRAQTDDDWMLTVIDDCYPDSTVAAYFTQIADPRISYRRNDANIGITANFRAAVQSSSHDHVCIMGSDDLLEPNYVAVVNAIARQNPNADIIETGVTVIDGTGNPISPLVDRVKRGLLAPRTTAPVTLTGEKLATSLIRGDWLYWPSLAFRTQTIRQHDFRDQFTIIQDLALLMDIAFAGGTLAYTPERAFRYRRHDESASQRTLLDGVRFDGEREYYRLATELARERGWKTTERAARLRLISRLHAIAALPTIMRRGNRAGVRSALRHIVAVR